MNAERRQQLIVELLDTDGRVEVSQLSARTGVSEMTVRRDLQTLEERGLLVRVHGGAHAAVGGQSNEPSFAARTIRNADAKRRIGRLAATLLTDGETVAIDAGTTTVELARVIADRRRMTVMALNLRVATLLADAPGISLMVAGGAVRPGEHSFVGPLAEQTFAQFTFDALILSVGGIDPAVGVTDYIADDINIKRAALTSARRRIALADASKLGHIAFARTCPVSDLDVLVTDTSADSAIVERIRDAGVEVLLA